MIESSHEQTWVVTRHVRTETELHRVHDQMERLSTAECFEYLELGGVGRVAFAAQDLAVVLPVNYAMDGREILFLTDSGSKLQAVQAGLLLTFEIDHVGEEGVGWSVLATGPAWSSADPAIIERVRELGVHPPAPEPRTHAVGIAVRLVTGRRFGQPHRRPLRRGEP